MRVVVLVQEGESRSDPRERTPSAPLMLAVTVIMVAVRAMVHLALQALLTTLVAKEL